MAALTDVYINSGARKNSCVLGALKTQIGHTKCAAGVGGLIKTALAIYNRVLPPTLNIEKPNKFYKKETSPFYFLNKSIPWIKEVRKSGISAFGFGGANFHALT